MVVKNQPPHPYIRWIRWIRTMMQLCASKARLRSSSSPFFFPVQKPWGDGGLPLPRIVFGGFVAMRAEVPKPCIPVCRLRRRMQPEAFRYDAVIRIAPQGNDELAGKRYNHRLA